MDEKNECHTYSSINNDRKRIFSFFYLIFDFLKKIDFKAANLRIGNSIWETFNSSHSMFNRSMPKSPCQQCVCRMQRSFINGQRIWRKIIWIENLLRHIVYSSLNVHWIKNWTRKKETERVNVRNDSQNQKHKYSETKSYTF